MKNRPIHDYLSVYSIHKKTVQMIHHIQAKGQTYSKSHFDDDESPSSNIIHACAMHIGHVCFKIVLFLYLISHQRSFLLVSRAV